MGTTGAQLDAWCKKNNVVGYRGVFCSDTVPTPFRPKNACFIVNHSVCASGGSHWLACRVQGSHCNWFDSYGLKPDNQLEDEYMTKKGFPQPKFVDWLSNMGVETLQYNDRDLQSVTTEVCGLYACYFAKHGMPFNNNPAWSFLTSNVLENDKKIKKLVKV